MGVRATLAKENKMTRCDCGSENVTPINEVEDLGNKITVGEEMPEGQCAKCEAFVYHCDHHRRLSRAVSMIERDYLAEVTSTVEEVEEMIKDGELKTHEQVSDWLHESIDGCQRVIYTFQARLGLLATDNADAFVDDFGTAPENESQAMYAAMMRDVTERLGLETCENCENLVHSSNVLCDECHEDEESNDE